ncbi:MAG: hypothetical protein P4M07_05215 [Xanthobacteraceae bacterium]|nr:hypothetical protein [Xanthobacteraceae bacterium]
MLARWIAGSLVAGVMAAAGVASGAMAEEMTPEQARQFVANKMFSFTCFDGSRGSGKIFADGSVVGSIQFSGTGPVRYAHLPVNTIQVRPNAVCASVKGIPFEPCFNLTKYDEVSFRGSVHGMGFAYCEFRRHGNSMIQARAHIRPHHRMTAEASRAEMHEEPAKAEPALELRRSAE